MSIYNASDTAWLSNKTYLVYVKGHGWTDGSYHIEMNGWCHKWAHEFLTIKNRGVTHFTEMPPPPNSEKGEK